MNIGKFLLDTVKARIIALKNQISLIDKQLAILPSSPANNMKTRFQFVLEKNLKLTTYNAFLQYYNSMSQLALSAFQLQQVVSAHLFALNLAPLQLLLQELYGHKQALATFLSSKSKCNSNAKESLEDDEPSIDDSLNFILTVFPFEISVHLLGNSSFFSFLLKTVLNYNPQKHKNIVYSVFKKIEDFFKSHPLSVKSIYFKHQNPLCYLLAEHFVSVFINKTSKNSLRDFSTAEKCAIIAQNGYQACQINLKLIEKIQNLSSSSSTNQSADETDDSSASLLPLSSNTTTENTFSSDNTTFSSSSIDPFTSSSNNNYFDEENDEIDASVIPAIRYSIYEFRKISLQPSPSEMLYILSKAIDSIQFLLASAKGSMVGADETFPFIIYCLSVSKLNRLPSIIDYIEKYSDSSLKETKFFYYVQHLKSSLSFIDNQKLKESPFYVFPFSKPPKNLEKILIRIKESKPLSLKGFSVYSFPLWYQNIPFPSLFHYSGGQEKAIGYQYKISDESFLDVQNQFKPIQTVDGTFLQLSDDYIELNSLIKVDGGDYDASIDDIEVISSMIAMNYSGISSDKGLKRLSTSMKNVLYEKYIKKLWALSSTNDRKVELKSEVAVRSTIAEVQISLIILEKLPPNFTVDGNLNYMTIEAIKSLFTNKNTRSNNFRDVIHPKVFYRIISETKKQNRNLA